MRSQVFAIYTDVLDSTRGGCEDLGWLWAVPERWQGSCSDRQEREQTEQGTGSEQTVLFVALPPMVFKMGMVLGTGSLQNIRA